MRRQNKETNKEDAMRTFAPPDPDSDDLDEFTEMYEAPSTTLRDDKKMTEETEQTEKIYDEEGYNSAGYDGAGYNAWGFNKNGFNEDKYNAWGFNKDGFNKGGYNTWGFNKSGFNKDGYDMWEFNEDGFNKDGKKDKRHNKWGYNINRINRQGFDKDFYNINGYAKNGLHKNSFNINGYDNQGFDIKGNKRKALKKNIPGSGLKILTPQQMLARLPISLAHVHAGNNSQKLKNEIRQLLYSLYRSKKICKTVYKNLIATI